MSEADLEVQGENVTEAEEVDDEMGAPSLEAALEALLIVAVEPMSTVVLAQATRRPVEEVAHALAQLTAQYEREERGFALREVAGGWRYYTRDTCSGVVERWVLDGQQARLTQAALETLAVVAYRQPVSRARISAVRGVNVDGVLRTLQSRGLIEEAGIDHSSQAILYRTTAYFLERLGIASLDDLPDLSEHVPDLAELDEVIDSVAAGE
ncbi:MAG: SMC-Scp complex subunit ScpB [Candidatus Nanopelagicales bacterium]